MGFYQEWKRERDCTLFIQRFLKKDPEAIESLVEGDQDEMIAAFEVLSRNDMAKYLDLLSSIAGETACTTLDIPNFSSFEAAYQTVPQILFFKPEGMRFQEIGEQIYNTSKEAARKYGEQQSRLASQLMLVSLSSSRPTFVSLTSWGEFLLQFQFGEKRLALIKTLLQNSFWQRFVLASINEDWINYTDMVEGLSYSSTLRRRQNIHHLYDEIVKAIPREYSLASVDWTVKK